MQPELAKHCQVGDLRGAVDDLARSGPVGHQRPIGGVADDRLVGRADRDRGASGRGCVKALHRQHRLFEQSRQVLAGNEIVDEVAAVTFTGLLPHDHSSAITDAKLGEQHHHCRTGNLAKDHIHGR